LASQPAGTQRRAGKANLLGYFATAAAGDGWQDGQAVWQDLLNQPITLVMVLQQHLVNSIGMILSCY
jgi:hypothetical protein